jgi:hypothetical protein
MYYDTYCKSITHTMLWICLGVWSPAVKLSHLNINNHMINQPIKVIINHVIPLFPTELMPVLQFHMWNIFVAVILGRKMVNVKVLYI